METFPEYTSKFKYTIEKETLRIDGSERWVATGPSGRPYYYVLADLHKDGSRLVAISEFNRVYALDDVEEIEQYRAKYYGPGPIPIIEDMIKNVENGLSPVEAVIKSYEEYLNGLAAQRWEADQNNEEV